MTVLHTLTQVIERVGSEKIALKTQDRQVSYQSLITQASKAARWLKQINSERVGLFVENAIDWVVIDLACQIAGLVCVPIPNFFSQEQFKHCVLKSGIDTIIGKEKHLSERLDKTTFTTKEHLNGEENQLACWQLPTPLPKASLPPGTQKITFTSGSTGNPKGVCLSQSHQWQVAQSLKKVVGLKNPNHLCLLPLSTLLENVAGVYATLLSGGTVLIPDEKNRGFIGSSQIDVEALLQCVNQFRPTTMIFIPQLLTIFVAACEKGWQCPSSLKYIAVGGARVSTRLLIKARALGLPVYQGYGLSECASVVAVNTPKDNDVQTVGSVLPHCSVSIENGEIVVQGSSCLGYLSEPNSWLQKKIHTGDLGFIKQGHIVVEGRKKNILITNYGRNISPEWIESELLASGLFKQVIVFGDQLNQLVCLIDAKPQLNEADIDSAIDLINATLPDYARIGRWHQLNTQTFSRYLTENGRVKREALYQAYKYLFETAVELDCQMDATKR